MLAHRLEPHTIEMTKPVIKSFRAACQQYDLHLGKEKKLKEKTDPERRAQLLAADIGKLRMKQKNLAKTIELMETECFHCMELAKEKDDMSFVVKGNGLKTKSGESKKEMEALEKQITELENKSKKSM